MEFMDVVRKRRSIRRYKNKPIPDEVLEEILESGRLAPSGANRQPWEFFVVTDQGLKERIEVPEWAAEAPAVLGVCGDPEVSQNWHVVDPTIAMEHMVLAAANLGLGTCWLGKLGRDDRIKAALGIPDRLKVIAITPVGYPDESPPAKDRKPLSQIVHYESF
jgi:nitroreductase